MSSGRSSIVIYGASGRAGRMIARALVRRGENLVLAGRSGRRLRPLADELSVRFEEVSVDDRSAISGLSAKAQTVINCAGPFHVTARPLAEEAIRCGAHYLDISGERRSVRALLDLDDDASAANITIAPAIGAKGALGIWAAALGIDTGLFGDDCERLKVAYAHAGSAYWRPTPGALLSAAAEGVEWEARRPLDHGLPPVRIRFPPPFAAGLAVHVSGTEDVMIPLHARSTLIVDSYLSVDPGTDANIAWGALHHASFAGLTRPAAPLLWRAMIDMGAEKLAMTLPPPEPGALAVVVEPVDPRGAGRIAVSADDGYAATVSTVIAVLDGVRRRRRAGVVPASTLLPPCDALGALAKAGSIRVLKDGRNRRSTRAPESR